MSNHSGGYMLNDVLLLLEEYEFFKHLNKTKLLEFIKKIISIGSDEDCNNGEILDEIGPKLGICYCCLEPAEEFEDDLCKKCFSE